MPASVERKHAHMLRDMMHQLVWTSHGVLDEAYSALREELCGIGQGSGTGLGIWVANSIVLIECSSSTRIRHFEWNLPTQLNSSTYFEVLSMRFGVSNNFYRRFTTGYNAHTCTLMIFDTSRIIDIDTSNNSNTNAIIKYHQKTFNSTSNQLN